jgi:hypothetical protein
MSVKLQPGRQAVDPLKSLLSSALNVTLILVLALLIALALGIATVQA